METAASVRRRWLVWFSLVGLLFAPALAPGQAGTIVGFDTSLGNFDVELYNADAPGTVANFLNYVTDGDYDSSFFHRLIPGFVLQGGGFLYDTVGDGFYFVPTDDPIENEFGHSNVRGTVAMAKIGGDPNSATSQFYVNLADNSVDLDNLNGGYTIFGVVRGDGMEVVDWLAAAEPNPYNVDVWDASITWSAWTDLPLIDYKTSDPSWPGYLEMVWNVSLVADADGDGRADHIDYCIWKEHAGTDSGADREQGDFDGDGDVDGDDFLILEATLGRVSHVASPAADTAGNPVPEPLTLSLLAMGGTLLIGRRRR